MNVVILRPDIFVNAQHRGLLPKRHVNAPESSLCSSRDPETLSREQTQTPPKNSAEGYEIEIRKYVQCRKS